MLSPGFRLCGVVWLLQAGPSGNGFHARETDLLTTHAAQRVANAATGRFWKARAAVCWAQCIHLLRVPHPAAEASTADLRVVFYGGHLASFSGR